MSRARVRVSAVVAAAMIVGWFLRVLVEKLPAWSTLAVMAAAFTFSILAEVADRSAKFQDRDERQTVDPGPCAATFPALSLSCELRHGHAGMHECGPTAWGPA